MLKNLSKHENEKIAYFVDVFLKHEGNGYAMNVPLAMRKGEPDPDGWCEWVAIDSPVTDEDLEYIELEIGFAIPNLFKAYLSYKCLLMTDFIVRLPQTPFDNPLKEIRNYFSLFKRSDSFFYKKGLIPFAYDSNDTGYVCFDTINEHPDDYKIVIVDITKMDQKGYRGDFCWDNFECLLDDIIKDILSHA